MYRKEKDEMHIKTGPRPKFGKPLITLSLRVHPDDIEEIKLIANELLQKHRTPTLEEAIHRLFNEYNFYSIDGAYAVVREKLDRCYYKNLELINIPYCGSNTRQSVEADNALDKRIMTIITRWFDDRGMPYYRDPST